MEGFFELVRYFNDEQEETTLFATEGCRQEFLDGYDSIDIDIVTFGKCFFTVSPITVLVALPSMWRIASKMAQLLDVENRLSRVIAFNFLVTEFIKYRAIEHTADGVESFHTLAPMPYQLKSIAHDHIYAYQHGIEAGGGDRSFSIPQYAAISYFVWGEAWIEEFEQKAHPESLIYPVGSPRYDMLVDQRGERNENIDVLFVSGTHVLQKEGYDKTAYRELVEKVVKTCEKYGWELAIKLHPVESAEYYEQRGYDEYIVDEGNISSLLLRSGVAVTDLSSAFTESVVLGTPMVVTQCSTRELDLEFVGEMDGLAFPDTLDEAIEEMSRMKGNVVPVRAIAESGFINLGDSRSTIKRIVMSV